MGDTLIEMDWDRSRAGFHELVSDELPGGKSAHDFDTPCPPTTTRFTAAARSGLHRSWRHATIEPHPYASRLFLPLTYLLTYIHRSVSQSQEHVDKEDSALLKSLVHAFGHADSSDEINDHRRRRR